MTEAHRTCLLEQKDRLPMTSNEIVLYGYLGNTLAWQKLLKPEFLYVLKTILTFAKAFALEICFRYTKSETENIGAAVEASASLPGTNLATSERHFCVAKTMLESPAWLRFVLDKDPNVFAVSNIDERTLATSSHSYMVSQLCAAKRCPTTPNRPKSCFLVHLFYNSSTQYVRALRILFSNTRSVYLFLFSLSGLDEFLIIIMPFQAIRPRIKIIQVFLN